MNPDAMRRIYSNCLALTTAAALLVSAACAKKPDERSPVVPPVRILTLGTHAVAGFRSYPGEVSALANARLSFDVGGRLVEFPVYDGKIISTGDLVGRLDATDFQSQFDSARARFVAARDEFARQTALFERRVIARSEFDRQREAYDVAEAALRTAEKALSDTRLVAPFKGRVAHRFVRNFQSVQPRELIVLLQDISSLKVDIQLPESAASRATRGASAEDLRGLIEAKAEFAALPGRTFDLTLDSFATRANPGSRTFPVSFIFQPPDDASLLPGMTCNVFVRFRDDSSDAGSDGGFIVPAAAVGTYSGKSVVWRWDAKSGRVSPQPVELLGPEGDGLLVRSPALSAGQSIVTSGVRFLSDGMAVRPLDQAR